MEEEEFLVRFWGGRKEALVGRAGRLPGTAAAGPHLAPSPQGEGPPLGSCGAAAGGKTGSGSGKQRELCVCVCDQQRTRGGG